MTQQGLMVTLKRVYDEPEPGDGTRVLVERLWPRGLSKERAHVDLWLKEIAPSDGLRRWFGHDPARFAEFARRYRAELGANPEAVSRMDELIKAGRVTLLYGARDEEHNEARVLADYIEDRPKKG